MADGSRINPVRRPVPCRCDAAVPEPSAGLPPIPDLPWESLSHRQVLAELRGVIEQEGPHSVAAVFMEPVQNSGGCFTPPRGS